MVVPQVECSAKHYRVNRHPQVERVVVRAEAFRVPVQKARALQSLNIRIDMSQQLKPLRGQNANHQFPAFETDAALVDILVRLRALVFGKAR